MRCSRRTPHGSSSILGADFRNTNADGTIVDRPAFIAQIARPSNLKCLACDDVEIRIFGDTAIIHARTVYVTSDGRPGTGRYTDIWRKQDGVAGRGRARDASGALKRLVAGAPALRPAVPSA